MTANRGESAWKSWGPLAIVIGLVMFVLPLAIRFPLLDPDEGLHAGIAQEMVERGDWAVPRFLGEPFLDKPILFFWAEAASMRLFGFNEAAARLPGLMFALLGAATTGLLAGRLFRASTGWIAGILYATTILPTAMAQAATHDVAIIPWINLALLSLWESQTGSRRKMVGCITAAGVFVGLSILTKGLAGAAVVGVAYGGYRLIVRRIDLTLVCQGMAVLAIAAAVAAPWYAALEMQNPGYLRYYLVDRHLLGVATASQPHGDQPWWYYFPLLLGGGLPWIGYLPIVARRTADSRSASVSPAPPAPLPFLWCWMIGWVVFLTVARSKLATYLWPAFPPMAILAAVAWSRLIDSELSEAAKRAFARTFVWSSWSGPIVLPAVLLVAQPLLDVRFSWPAWTAAVVVALATPLPLIPWRARRWSMALEAAALSLTAQFLVVMTSVLPQAANRFSARDLAGFFNEQGRMPQRLFIVEERIGSVVFYLNANLREGLTADRLNQLSLDQPVEPAPGDAIAVPRPRIDYSRGVLRLGEEPGCEAGRYRVFYTNHNLQ